MKILIIEDDQAVSKVVELALSNEGIKCESTEYGEDGVVSAKFNDYDLIILDIMLPDISGYDVLKQIRKVNPSLPVLILSGLGEYNQKIKGLGSGADDYLSKPFNTGELVARVKAILRRVKGSEDTKIFFGDFEVDIVNHTTKLNGKQVHLTNKEQGILEILASKRGSVVTKENFIVHLYNGTDEPEFKIIDVFVCKLRKKLYDISGVNYIETVWGRGYSLRDPRDLEAKPENLLVTESR